MSSAIKKTKTVYEQWLEVPETVVGEIIMGDLHMSPRPALKHGNASSSLLHELMGPYHKGKGGPGGWIIMIEPEIHLAENIIVPDIGGWKRDRIPEITNETFFSVAPDWVCEVLSPSSAGFDRVKKMPLYLEQKVKHIWLIDPLLKTLEVFENNESSWVLIKTFMNTDKVRVVPFIEIEIDLSMLWI
jgi:Uma2 family endonuclease